MIAHFAVRLETGSQVLRTSIGAADWLLAFQVISAQPASSLSAPMEFSERAGLHHHYERAAA